jgi:uncharacterized protein YlxW (UPF0749 family)
MSNKSKGIIFVAFIILGMVITMQFRTIISARQPSVIGESSVQKLTDELEQIRAEGLKLHEQLQRIEKEIEEAERRLSNDSNPIINELLIRKDELELICGLLDVKGRGVVVTLNDAPARDPDMDPNELIIHDGDISAVLNELKAAGAQAISINDERILATSKQICAGPTILINRNRYPVPYVIKAIGDPDLLYQALEESEAVVIMRLYNIRVDIKKEDEIVIPKFKAYKNIDSMISGMEVIEK